MGSQQKLEDIIAWWVHPLELSHYQIEAKWDNGSWAGSDPKANGEAWISPNYPISVINIRPTRPDDRWQHDDIEAIAVHELVHTIVEPIRNAYLDLLAEIDLPQKAYNMVFQTMDRHVERAVETIAIALVAAAHADRGGPAPSIGGIVKREAA